MLSDQNSKKDTVANPICTEAYYQDESTERHTAQRNSKELMKMKDISYNDTKTDSQTVEPVVYIAPEGCGVSQTDYPHNSVKTEKPGILSTAFKMVMSYVKGSDGKQKPVTDAIK